MDQFYTSLFEFGVRIISELGYFGIYIGMVIDSLGFPIPSQAIMGFAGYMVYKGTFNLWLAAFVGGLGNTTGGTIIYLLSKKYGRGFVKKFGKYIKFTEKDMEETDNWFKKWGDELVFFAQLIPGLRTMIAIPGGIWKVKITKFIPYLLAGCSVYSFVMTYLGYKFGSNWEKIGYYMDTFENITYLLLFLGLCFLVYKYIKRKRTEENPSE